MSDKTDPRLGVLRAFEDDVAWATYNDGPGPLVGSVLADLDAADRAAGIVRVDTTDEQVKAVAARTWNDEVERLSAEAELGRLLARDITDALTRHDKARQRLNQGGDEVTEGAHQQWQT